MEFISRGPCQNAVLGNGLIHLQKLFDMILTGARMDRNRYFFQMLLASFSQNLSNLYSLSEINPCAQTTAQKECLSSLSIYYYKNAKN